MQYRFVAMNEQYANEIINNWHYDGIYSFYDMAADEEDLRIFNNRTYWANTTFAVLNSHDELVGWSSFFIENKIVWLSLGLKPELTGLGLGERFVSECVIFALTHYNPDKLVIKLEVALFNQRAIKVYKRAGFTELSRITKNTHVGKIEFLKMGQVITN